MEKKKKKEEEESIICLEGERKEGERGAGGGHKKRGRKIGQSNAHANREVVQTSDRFHPPPSLDRDAAAGHAAIGGNISDGCRRIMYSSSYKTDGRTDSLACAFFDSTPPIFTDIRTQTEQIGGRRREHVPLRPRGLQLQQGTAFGRVTK